MFKRYAILIVMTLAFNVDAASVLQPDNPAQFISYWKSDVITSDQDELVAFSEAIFKRLLRAWDSNRHEPGLYVVDSDQGAWAVSLVDGNILLSRQAIVACKRFGVQRAQHLLAFILAHELAHQRSDDLWQHRFFRLNNDENAQQSAVLGLQMDRRMLKDMQQKEFRADHDGLVLMASVGFNPYQIVDKKDFFTQWVENIWQQPCDDQQDSVVADACHQARQRAIRARTQLETVASQSSLYQLGIQSMVAGEYEKARLHFAQYARDLPGRAVMTALGISHLSQAIELRKTLIQSGVIVAADFYFPLILDATAGFNDALNLSQDGKRSTPLLVTQQQREQLQMHIQQAVEYFEKAIRFAPDNRRSYQLLASAYILGENSFMARGILQGRYIPKFGEDVSTKLLLAITTSIEGQHEQSISMLDQLAHNLYQDMSKGRVIDDLLGYSIIYNLTALLKFEGKEDEASSRWKSFARVSKGSGNALLFRLGLAQVQSTGGNQPAVLEVAPTINGLRLGNRKTRDDSSHTIKELWIEGDQYHVYNYDNGAQFITGIDGRIISAKQLGGQASLGLLKTGDGAERPLKTLGLPDRRLHLVSGEYLAYDQYGLAVHIDNKEILGWFLY